jgi:hypothetical protein
MTFLLCFLASGIGITGCIYASAALATLCRRDWAEGFTAIGIAAIPLALYAVAWWLLPMENWLILPGIVAGIASILTFTLTLKNGI